MKAIRLFVTTAVLVLFSLCTSGRPAPQQPLAFGPGEKLTFRLKWTIIPAGEAVLQVLPDTTIEGATVRHFALKARTNAFVDVFYRVRDRIDAYTDHGMTRSVFFKKKQREGSTRRNVHVTFDWRGKKARYFNFNRPVRTTTLLPGTFDPLSAFFWVRLARMRAALQIARPVTDGKKTILGRVRVIRREKIRVAGKTYDTFLLQPELTHVGGVFEKSPHARIAVWVTADRRKLPVRVKSKVVVGSFVAELIKAEGLRP